MEGGVLGWPDDDRELIDLQQVLAEEAQQAVATDPWSPPARPAIGGCFVAFARGEAGPGHPGDRAWAAAVVWRPGPPQARGGRAVDRHLRRTLGVALHLGAILGVPTVGVTHRPLVARGPAPELRAGATAPIRIDGRCVAYWVCTRTGVRPVVAHAAWRTSPETAAQIVLTASTEAARTPVPLQEARRMAREARALADPDPSSRGATKPVVPGHDP